MMVVNKIWLLGEDLSDSRIVEKLFINFSKRFEAIISSLEDLRGITEISSFELINVL